jgi:hypothetical protein
LKQWIVLLLVAGLLLFGCAVQTYRIEGDELTLILNKPHARKVVLACSLDGFRARSAKSVNGRWEVTLPAGRSFSYFYRVDGALFLPDCALTENDDFGSENCIFDPRL